MHLDIRPLFLSTLYILVYQYLHTARCNFIETAHLIQNLLYVAGTLWGGGQRTPLSDGIDDPYPVSRVL